MVGKLFRPYIVVTILCLVYCLAVIAVRGQGDPLILMTIGSDYHPDLQEHAYSDEGYDGQYTYYIAVNPDTASQFIDVPAYRFQRILLPLSGRILGLGQESLIPYALLIVNLIALAGGTYILEQLLLSYNVSRWFAIGYGLSLGVFGATRLMTAETLAYGLVLLAIWLFQKDKWLWAALVLALSAFAKEVTLLFVAGYVLYLFTQKQWLRGLTFGLISAIPFAIWQLVLFNWFGEFGVGSGGDMATGFVIIPFWGYLGILPEWGIEAFLIVSLFVGIFVLIPTLWALWQCWKDFRQQKWTLLTWLLFINAAILLFVPQSTYREILGILRFIVGLQIAVILFSAKNRKKRALMNSTLWFITTLFLLMSDFSVQS